MVRRNQGKVVESSGVVGASIRIVLRIVAAQVEAASEQGRLGVHCGSPQAGRSQRQKNGGSRCERGHPYTTSVFHFFLQFPESKVGIDIGVDAISALILRAE